MDKLLVLTVYFLLYLSSTATLQTSSSNNQIGLEQPTNHPPQISDSDLSSLIDNVFNTDSTTVTGSVASTTEFPKVGNNDRLDTSCVEQQQHADSFSDNCECVPYYRCDTNRTVIEDGTGLIDIRMKEGPCNDYLDVCCKREDTLPTYNPVTRTPSVKQTQNDTCGRRNFDGVSTLRITGDTNNEAQFGEFPWIVAVVTKQLVSGKYTNVFKCGGSLIHPKVVLTAAHCVQGQTDLIVRAGEWDTQRTNEPLPTQNRPVREVVIHEEFNPGPLFNDIALLFLEASMDPALNVAPICLPAQGENMDNRQCVASGWGKNVFGKEGKYQVILKKLDLPIVAREPCIQALRQTRLGQRFRLHTSFICAGGELGKDTCKGDGGGPLMCPSVGNSAIYMQAGIVSWGIGCGTETPGVYVNVAQFRNWIDNKMSIYNIDPRVDQ